jgi:hypothetical protein
MVEQGDLLQGIVEADDTYIGGKENNKHKDSHRGAEDAFGTLMLQIVKS